MATRPHPHLQTLLAEMPPLQRERFLAALDAGWTIETDWPKITARYRDIDHAEQVPREIIYLDLGVLAGRIQQLEAFLATLGYEVDRDA